MTNIGIVGVSCNSIPGQLQISPFSFHDKLYVLLLLTAPPTSVSISALNATSLEVSWSPPPNDPASVSAYEITCVGSQSEGNTLTTTVGPLDRSAIIAGGLPSTTYECCVRAAYIVTNDLSPPICEKATTYNEDIREILYISFAFYTMPWPNIVIVGNLQTWYIYECIMLSLIGAEKGA